MSLQHKLLMTMVLMVVLPLSVTVITWLGLSRMNVELEQVAEEFAEARVLQPIESDLALAVDQLRQGGADPEAVALERLRAAETAMVGFLSEQYDSVAEESHQAEEAAHASRVLRSLQQLIAEDWDRLPATERAKKVQEIQRSVQSLYRDADTGVLRAPIAAQATRRRTMALVLVASLVSASVCVVLSAWSTRRVSGRLRELRRSVAARSDGDQTPEPRDVGGVMNQIEELNERMVLKLEEKNRELLRRERMAGIGLLAADVAHEINNPMNAMLGLSELSLQATGRGPIDEDGRGELHESLTVIRREVLRCRGIVERLMAMVRGSGEPQWFDVSRLLTETVSVARAARPDKARCFVVIGDERTIKLYASAEDVRQIVLTLLINAADAVGDDGRIEVDCTRTDREVWLRVRDNGKGFSPDTEATFGVPFATTRRESGGAGLGLSIAHTIAADIGAELRAFSDGPGAGSLFVLVFASPEDTE